MGVGSGGNVGVLENLFVKYIPHQTNAAPCTTGGAPTDHRCTQHEALRVGKADDRRTYVVGPQLSATSCGHQSRASLDNAGGGGVDGGHDRVGEQLDDEDDRQQEGVRRSTESTAAPRRGLTRSSWTRRPVTGLKRAARPAPPAGPGLRGDPARRWCIEYPRGRPWRCGARGQYLSHAPTSRSGSGIHLMSATHTWLKRPMQAASGHAIKLKRKRSNESSTSPLFVAQYLHACPMSSAQGQGALSHDSS